MPPDGDASTAIGSLEALLVETFGIPLLAFMCGTDDETLRARVEGGPSLGEPAENVLLDGLVPIAQTVAATVASQPNLPRAFSLEFLGQVTNPDAFSLGVAMREASGVPIPDDLVNRNAEDPVKKHLTRMAIDSFPMLLAPLDSHWPRPNLMHFRHPTRTDLQSAVQSDSALRRLFPEEDQGGIGRRGEFYTSLGRGGSFQDVMFSEMIVGSAWETLRMTKELPGLSELVDQVHTNVDVLRKAATGGSATVPARVVFTGFTTRDEEAIQTPWGSLRPLHEWERRLAPPSLEGAVSGTHPDGSQVTVSYAGELVLETEVPYGIHVPRIMERDPRMPWPIATDALQRQFEGVQLAALLASDRPEGNWATAKLAWTWVGDPFGHGSAMGWSDTRSGPGFMPLELTPEECREFGIWAQRVKDGWTPRIDIAVRRILSAANARTDMADRLVDSVIVWENLFGTSQGEPRLRISAAIAWLLVNDPGVREELQGKLKNLYDYRSRIVHGGQPDQTSLGEHANLALTYARDALRALLRDRTDVLALPDGAARSLRMIMGG